MSYEQIASPIADFSVSLDYWNGKHYFILLYVDLLKYEEEL